MNIQSSSLPVACFIGALTLFSAAVSAQQLPQDPVLESGEQPAVGLSEADLQQPEAQAELEVEAGDETQNAADEEAVVEQIRQRLVQRLPQLESAQISSSSIAGLFEVIAGSSIYYVNESADYLIDGSLIRLSDRVNVTESRLGKIQMKYIDDMDEKDMLIYEPDIEPTGTLTVFTDISCGYCRRLHGELDTLLDSGVRVRYLLFPRAGLGSQGHDDLVSVWCAENPQEAMTNAKAGGKIEPLTCDNPIEKHVELAQTLGLRGTPLMFTDSGEKIPGYRPAEELAVLITEAHSTAQ